MSDYPWVTINDDAYVRETDDPRHLALIVRDDMSADAPDGDCYAPAYYLDRFGAMPAGNTYQQDDLEDGLRRADERWGLAQILDEDSCVRRYLRIFHGVRDVRRVAGCVQGEYVYVFDTDAWREDMGFADDVTSDDVLAGSAHDWDAYLMGDVWGIGTLTIDRVTHDADVRDYLDSLTSDDLIHAIECWGYYGEDYAQREAVALAEYNVAHDEQPLIPIC